MSLQARLTDLCQAVGADIKALWPWAAKTPPVGAVVGATDAQTLSNKTLDAPAVSRYVTHVAQQQVVANTSSTTVDFSNGQKAFVDVRANTTLYLSVPAGVGHYQMVIYMNGGSWAVTINNVQFWLGAASQPPLNTAVGGRTLVSLFFDGSYMFCGVAKCNAV
jgi:hypothetical protein